MSSENQPVEGFEASGPLDVNPDGRERTLLTQETLSPLSSKPTYQTEKADKSPPSSSAVDVESGKNYLHGIKLVLAITSLGLAVFVIALDTAVLTTAIPFITNEFHTVADIGWYGSAYLITICALQPLAAKIHILYPVKWAYIGYLFFFELGSLICAVAPSSLALIMGRWVSGIGSAGLFSGAMVIISHIAPLHRRPAYTGIVVATYSLSAIVGPVIGGGLTQYSTWRWCFYINLPIGGLLLLLVLYSIPTLKPTSPQRKIGIVERIKQLDIPGTVMFSGSIVMILMALQWGGNKFAWRSATIIGLFCGGGLLLIVFFAWQFYLQDEASIPPSTFMQRTMGFGALTTIMANGGINIIIYWLPIWFQAVLGSSPVLSGVEFIPTMLANVLISIIAGGAVSQLGYYNPFLYVGIAFCAISAGLFTTFTVNSTRGAWIGYQVLAGFGHGMVIQMPLTAVQAVLPMDKIASGTALITSTQFLGGAVFLAIAQSVFQNRIVDNLSVISPPVNVQQIADAGATAYRGLVDQSQQPAVIDAYNGAITDTFWVALAGALIAVFTSLGMQWVSVKVPGAEKKNLDAGNSEEQAETPETRSLSYQEDLGSGKGGEATAHSSRLNN